MKVLTTCIAALTLSAGSVSAQSWIHDRLAGAEVVYETGNDAPAPSQSWDSEGGTVYDSGQPLLGQHTGFWEVRHGQYCSYFGPVDHRDRDWTCWNVEFPAEDTVVFSAPPGPWIGAREVTGRFVR